MSNKRRIHIYYSGYVQGVGFRFTTRSIATQLGLVGWVKNLRDGRVELVCEGEAITIKQFIASMEDEFKGNYIKHADIKWEDPTKEFSKFEMTF